MGKKTLVSQGIPESSPKLLVVCPLESIHVQTCLTLGQGTEA
jgi:hypothetical protein